MKTCRRGHLKTPENTGPRGNCRTCDRERASKWYEENLKSKEPIKRFCKRGHERTADNLDSSGGCKICKTINERKRYTENPEKYREISKTKRLKDPERTRELQRKHHKKYATKRNKKNRNWKKENREKVNAYLAKRRAAKIERTPLWLTKRDYEQIEAFYLTARIMTDTLGIVHHVDHIVPLQGDNVSGLHVPWNLQVIPAIENQKKRNAFIPGRAL